MEHRDLIMRKQQLLYRLTCLPEKIISAHEVNNLAEFVLYELCHPECLNLGKAAFFVDNPDFDCLRGVAGISHDESKEFENKDVWQMHDSFSSSMKESAFNSAVRAVATQSLAKSGMPIQKEVEKIISYLPRSVYQWNSFNTKHGNLGILIFEPMQDQEEAHVVEEHIVAGASLLAFCPIF